MYLFKVIMFLLYIFNVWIIIDEDICTTMKQNCSKNAKCTDLVGAFNCTCLDNYYGDGYTCNGNQSLLIIILYNL